MKNIAKFYVNIIKIISILLIYSKSFKRKFNNMFSRTDFNRKEFLKTAGGVVIAALAMNLLLVTVMLRKKKNFSSKFEKNR